MTTSVLLFANNLSNYCLDRIADSLIEENVPSSEGTNSFLKIFKEDTTYQDMYSTFDYSLNNDGFNIESLSDCIVDSTNSIKITTQRGNELVQNDYSGSFYYLSTGHFFTHFGSSLSQYFSNNDRWYLMKRNGADAFMFISDTLADYLVEKYGLSEEENPYKKLILDPAYSNLTVDYADRNGDLKQLVFCINDIITSSKRQGVRYKNLYNFYANVAYSQTKEYFDYSATLNFKNNKYAIKTCMEKTKLLGYDSLNSNIEITKYNKDKMKLVTNIELTEKYRDYTVTKYNDSLWNSLIFSFVFISAALSVFFCYMLRENKIVLFGFVTYWMLLLIICVLFIGILNLYFYLSIIPIICFATNLIFLIKKVLSHGIFKKD